MTEARKGRDKYSPADETKTVPSSPGNGLESTIATLETQLHEKNTQLQKAQASLLRQGHRLDEYAIDDRRIHERFSQLSKSINDWVVAHFKTLGPEISATPESLFLLRESQPNYAMLLRSPRTKYLVIRGFVGDIILGAFTTGELLGSPAFCEIKKAIEAKCKRYRTIASPRSMLIRNSVRHSHKRMESINRFTTWKYTGISSRKSDFDQGTEQEDRVSNSQSSWLALFRGTLPTYQAGGGGCSRTSLRPDETGTTFQSRKANGQDVRCRQNGRRTTGQ